MPLKRTTATLKPRPKLISRDTGKTSRDSVKTSRYIRHGEVLDDFLIRNYRSAGYHSPNAYIVGLIRREMQLQRT